MEQMYLGGQNLIMGCSATGWKRCIWEAKTWLWAVVPLDGTDVFWRLKFDYGLWCHWMEQMYLEGQSLIMGCSATGWNRCIWKAKVWLWAVVPQDGTDVFWRLKFDYGLWCHWMEQMYLGGQSLIMGCSATGWNRCILEAKFSLWAVVPLEWTDVFERSKFDYGL